MRKDVVRTHGAALFFMVSIALACMASCARTEEEEYEKLLAESVEILDQKQEVLSRDFRLGEHERWHWDQDTGELTFFDNDDAVVKAKVQFVGTISKSSGTWLWAWGNVSIREHLSADSKVVREFGRRKGYRKLTTAMWEGNTVDGWNMTALAARTVNAMGAYRTPDENGFTYLLIKDIEWVK